MRPVFLRLLATAVAAQMLSVATAQALPPINPVPQSSTEAESRTPMSRPTSSSLAETAPSPFSARPVGQVPRQGTGATEAPIPKEPLPATATPYDYSANLRSDVFGAQLFTGAFSRQGATQFNPDYAIAVGDRIQLRLWGAFDFESVLTVDAQGSIFLPHIGPVRVLGVRNQELQRVVEAAVRKTFRANVHSYVSLAAAQPVRVFVSGFVNRPGLYGGTSMDSLLSYLDQAGGVDLERGSFLTIQVKRGSDVRAIVNLYDFLLDGRLPVIQLTDGDVIFVAPRQNTVTVAGLAENAKRFEFSTPRIDMPGILKLAKPNAQATHVRVTRNTGTVRNTEYFPLQDAATIAVANGDMVEFTADKKPGTITVRVEGEHLSPQEFVLPYGSRLGSVMQHIAFSDRSDSESIQLIRQSVRERQKQMLQTALKSLESSVLTARSGTSDEARLRKEEAELILQWVDRARRLETSGQVLIAKTTQRDELLLENGDIIRIPTRDGLVLVSGEVLFPNAVAYEPALNLGAYIRNAGGYAQNADTARIIVAHRDGSFEEATERTQLRAGDEILVLPKIDVKSRQILKELTQIIYQIAVSAKVVLTGF